MRVTMRVAIAVREGIPVRVTAAPGGAMKVTMGVATSRYSSIYTGCYKGFL